MLRSLLVLLAAAALALVGWLLLRGAPGPSAPAPEAGPSAPAAEPGSPPGDPSPEEGGVDLGPFEGGFRGAVRRGGRILPDRDRLVPQTVRTARILKGPQDSY